MKKMGNVFIVLLFVVPFLFILALAAWIEERWTSIENRHRARCSGLRGADHYVSDSCRVGAKKAVGQANRKVV